MKDKVLEMIEDKTNEIIAKLQAEKGINYGDIDPCDALALQETQNKLAEIICKVIEYEESEE